MRQHRDWLLRRLPLVVVCIVLLHATSDSILADDGPWGSIRTELASHSLCQPIPCDPPIPYFENVRTFNKHETETIEVAVDGNRFPAIHGKTCSLFVTEAKTAEEWLLEPWLVDARSCGPQTHIFPGSGSIESRDFRVEVLRRDELSSDAGPCFGGVCIIDGAVIAG